MGEVRQSLANPIVGLQNKRSTSAITPVYDAPASLRLWHLTSLDAPTVAVTWTLAFAWAAGIALPLWVPILLGLTAWAVYIGDRLLDAYSALRTFRRGRLRVRHRFHWRHRRILLPIAIAAACAAAVLVFSCMPVAARERNSLLAAAALIYFTRVHSTHGPAGRVQFPERSGFRLRTPFPSPLIAKEMLVGLIFTAACALPALARTTPYLSALGTLILTAVFFALLAWLNCHAIERWESRPQPTIPARIFAPALSLALIGLPAAAILAGNHPRPAALIAAGALSALLLALLDRQRGRLTPLALRTAADLVLLTPLPLLFLSR